MASLHPPPTVLLRNNDPIINHLLSVKVVKILLDHGAKLEAKNKKEETCVDLARNNIAARIGLQEFFDRIDVVANNVIRHINREELSTQELDEFVHINNIQPQLLVAKIGEKNSAIDASKEIKMLENYRSKNFGYLSKIHGEILQKENKNEPSLADLAREPNLLLQIYKHLKFEDIKPSTSKPGSSHIALQEELHVESCHLQLPVTGEGGGVEIGNL